MARLHELLEELVDADHVLVQPPKRLNESEGRQVPSESLKVDQFFEMLLGRPCGIL